MVRKWRSHWTKNEDFSSLAIGNCQYFFIGTTLSRQLQTLSLVLMKVTMTFFWARLCWMMFLWCMQLLTCTHTHTHTYTQSCMHSTRFQFLSNGLVVRSLCRAKQPTAATIQGKKNEAYISSQGKCIVWILAYCESLSLLATLGGGRCCEQNYSDWSAVS